MYRRISVFVFVLVFATNLVSAQSSCTNHSVDPCQGKTLTQGGWGVSNCSNPNSSYLSAHFGTVFPSGLTIGCGTKKLKLTSPAAVIAFLPSGSTATSLPTGTLTNPGSGYSNVLAGQLVALTLNTAFDASDPGFSSSGIPLLNYSITTGTFSNMTVGAFLSLANSVIGGCSTAYSFSQINAAATSINENYDNGTSNDGFLACSAACNVTATAVAGSIRCNGGTTTATITASGGSGPYSGTGVYTVGVGPHNYTVTAANGCTASTGFTLTQPNSILTTVSIGSISCYGGFTTATITASGGTAPYMGTGVFTVSAGSHTYLVTDSRGCVSTSGSSGGGCSHNSSNGYTVTQPPALLVNSTCGVLNCNGIGSVSITASGGTAPYTGTGTFSTSVGTYSYFVTDANGCSGNTSRTFTAPSSLSVSISTGSILCHGGATTLAVTATGGIAPYSGTGIFTVTAGTYTKVVTDSRGCTAYAIRTVTAPAGLTTSVTTGTILCYGGSTTATISASGGTGPYSGIGVFTVSAGTHTYQVTDTRGCKSSCRLSGREDDDHDDDDDDDDEDDDDDDDCGGSSSSSSISVISIHSYTVTQPSSLVPSSSGGVLNCSGAGTISISASGGTAPYAGTGTYTASVGTHSYLVTDAHGCTVSINRSFTAPSSLSITVSKGTIACYGGSTTLTVSALGGLAPYTGTGVFTVTAGTYTRMVTDSLGCTGLAVVTLTAPTAFTANSLPGTILCNNGSTTFTLSGNGGTTPYSGTGVFTVNAGPHSYTVADANGCLASTGFTLTQPSMLIASSSSGSISCIGGTTNATVLASGGSSPYGGAGIFTVSAGPHSYTVTDANGCSALTGFTLTQPSLLLVTSAAASISCNGAASSATVSASGGSSPYSGVGIFTVNAGPHSYTVTDVNGCSASTGFSLTQPSALVLSTSAGTILCNGGTTTVNVSASSGTSPFTGTGIFAVSAGTHTYPVTDANGCSSTASIVITQPSLLTATISHTNGSCSNNNLGSATVSASGGTGLYSYSWNTSATTNTLGGLAAGSYSVTVYDANECMASANTSINITPCCNVTSGGAISGSTANCGPVCGVAFGSNSLPIGGLGTIQYIWIKNSQPNFPNNGSNGWVGIPGTNSPTFAPGCVTVTTYYLRCARRSGCTSYVGESNMLSVIINSAPAISSTSGSILCNGGSATCAVTASDGSSPYVGTGVFTISAGPHNYTVTDANGCSGSTGFTLTQPSLLTSSSNTGTILCNGCATTVSITATGGTGPYTGTGTFTMTAGTHTYLVSDAHGCTSTGTYNLSQPAPLVGSSSTGSILCQGGTTTATVSATGGVGPYTGTGIYTVSAGTHTYLITDANGNTTVVSFTITQPSSLSAATSVGSVLCNGGLTTVTVSASGGTSPYTGTGAFSVSAGTYSYQVSDANGCTAIVSCTVTQPSVLIATSNTGTILCNGCATTVSITATGGTGPYTGTGTFTMTAGTHTYLVTDANGCTSTGTYNLTQPAPLVGTSSTGSILCNGGTTTATVNATGGVGPYTGTGVYTVSAGTHTYLITDANGNTTVVSFTNTQPSLLVSNATAGNFLCNGGSTTVSVTATGGTGAYTGTGVFTISAGTYTYVVTDANGCSATT
ncbi:MAG: hypothetical protein PSX36_05150, partial [bacterium]|nr:hypothetical protein [bacterium]